MSRYLLSLLTVFYKDSTGQVLASNFHTGRRFVRYNLAFCQNALSKSFLYCARMMVSLCVQTSQPEILMLCLQTNWLELERTADISELFVKEFSHLAGKLENTTLFQPCTEVTTKYIGWCCQSVGLIMSHCSELLMFYSEDTVFSRKISQELEEQSCKKNRFTTPRRNLL